MQPIQEIKIVKMVQKQEYNNVYHKSVGIIENFKINCSYVDGNTLKETNAFIQV